MHEAGFDTLKAWENFLDAPELTAYLIYPILKLVMFSKLHFANYTAKIKEFVSPNLSYT